MTPAQLAPLPVAIPLVAGALCGGIGPFVPRRVLEVLAIVAAAAGTCAAALVTIASTGGTVVEWFGGWQPHHGIALGIAFVVDPVGGALATFASLLTLAALIFAWNFFEEGGPAFPALMLVFVGALCGFFLTGDLFNLFVFFELMGVAAYALTGYRSEDENAVLGAIAFAVVNSAGAFLILIGITLTYARTGALNMAQVSHALASAPADPLVMIAFAFVAIGLMVKASMIPFHFWLSEAHAVAPTPLCVLFSGIMVQAGLYAIARCWWSVYGTALQHHAAAVHGALLGLGLATAVVGAAMSLVQRHLKRLLAFSTIAHAGTMMTGIAALDARGLSGLWLTIIGHGFIKGALFMAAGIVLNCWSSLDLGALRGALRGRWWLAALFTVGALGLAGVPPFGMYLGASQIGDALRDAGLSWAAWVNLVASAVTGAAVLAAAGKLTFGWGPPPSEGTQAPAHEEPETRRDPQDPPVVMLVTASSVLALSFGMGFVHPAIRAARAASERFADPAGQLAAVLHGTPSGPLPPVAPVPLGSALTDGAIGGAIAVVIAAYALFGHRIALRDRVGKALDVAMTPLHAVHSGLLGDEIAWLTVGTAVVAAALGLSVR